MMRNAIATAQRLANLNPLDLGVLPVGREPFTKSNMLHRSKNSIGIALLSVLFALAAHADPKYDALAIKFEQRAESGDPIAQNNLGALYLKGRGVEQSYDKARYWFESAVAAELPGAMFNLAMVYLRGYGVGIDVDKSNDLLERSASKGDRDAQFFLGLHYSSGTGFEKDLEAAKLWFRRAAEQQVAAAMYNLGVLYLDPAVDNDALAIEWLEKAAAANYPGVELTIAKVNLSRSDNPERVALGVKQYTELAESNNLDAQIQLGMLYTLGQGVAQNFDEGRFWLERAATQGSAQAQLNLGNIYADGVGVEQDLGKAMAWYTIAADNGDPAATRNADLLATKLSDTERSTAETEATRLRQRYGAELDTVGQ